MRAILADQRRFWRLAQNMTADSFVAFLKESANLKVVDLPFPLRAERCYIWGDVPLMKVLLSIRKAVYLSHYSAMRLHGLTEQSPTTIYELAKDRVSINTLMAMLQKLNFSYPYHQAIGYYVERAGFKPSQIDLIRRVSIDRDFYLTHEMGATRHVRDWRLTVPHGF